MSNKRPADFPTDAELAVIQQQNTLAALFDAFVGNDEWDEHDVRTRFDHEAAQWGAEDARSGLLFVPEQFFVPGTLDYHAYCAGYYAVRMAVAA